MKTNPKKAVKRKVWVGVDRQGRILAWNRRYIFLRKWDYAHELAKIIPAILTYELPHLTKKK